jgi:DNA (cytosine-5)-methyltransferase 1
MDRPRLLDLFCGAGGCSMGYHRAGFDVTGVDIKPQPRYPFKFIQADVMGIPDSFLDEFDVIHASPPCKRFTKTGWAKYFGYNENHEDLLTPIRERLLSRGGLWVIENVPGAPLKANLTLCGSYFGLNLKRHRLFETNPPIFLLVPPCSHKKGVASPHGHARKPGELASWRIGLGIDWMNEDELAQAIPPAYTEFIGKQLMDYIRSKS